MGGLGLGNVLALRFGDAVRRPLRAYALVEAAVASMGVALVYTLPVAGIALARSLPESLPVPALQAVRLVAAFALLLVPSTGMGITLPLLTGALTSAGHGFGGVLGRLYAANTLGATAGVLLTETVLVPAL